MTIWIITDKNGKYICAFRNQDDAFRVWDNNRSRYDMFQSSAD